MVGLFGLTSRRANRAMKTSYEDTDRPQGRRVTERGAESLLPEAQIPRTQAAPKTPAPGPVLKQVVR